MLPILECLLTKSSNRFVRKNQDSDSTRHPTRRKRLSRAKTSSRAPLPLSTPPPLSLPPLSVLFPNVGFSPNDGAEMKVPSSLCEHLSHIEEPRENLSDERRNWWRRARVLRIKGRYLRYVRGQEGAELTSTSTCMYCTWSHSRNFHRSDRFLLESVSYTLNCGLFTKMIDRRLCAWNFDRKYNRRV